MNELLKQCIAREGNEAGRELYSEIIDECCGYMLDGSLESIEEVLYNNGFEPDYVMDVFHAIA